MSRKKTSTKITSRHEMIDAKTENFMNTSSSYTMNRFGIFNMKRLIGVGLAVLVVVAAVYLIRGGYLVVATVNGKPVYRWEFSNMLVSRFGAQTLETMITERLISDAASKEGVNVTKADVDGKLNDIVKTLGPNVKLEDLLKYQGMTKPDFENQIKLQLTVERILGKDVSVTDADIDTYIKENKTTLTATDAGAMRDEARTTLVSQQISEKIQPWLTDLKSKAKITKFLK